MTGASSGGATFCSPDAGAPVPVRRTPMGSTRSSAVGVRAGMRGAAATAALAVGAAGISSLRRSAVAAVGLSRTSFESASSDFLPLPVKRWIVNAETATREPISSATASKPFFEIELRRLAATLGMPGSPGSGEIVLPPAPLLAGRSGSRSGRSLGSCIMVRLPFAHR